MSMNILVMKFGGTSVANLHRIRNVALIINKKYKTLLPKKNLEEKFSSIGLKNQKNVVFTCGSSVTASVLGLAYKEINNNYTPTIYVGSWSEYGKIK